MNIPMRWGWFVAAAFGLPASVSFAQLPPWEQYGPGNSESGGVVDGTPTASVAAAAADTVDMGALITPEEVVQTFPATAGSSGTTDTGMSPAAQIDIEAGGGSGTVNGQDFEIYTFKVPYSRKINDRGALQLSAPFSFSSYKDAKVTWDSNGVANLSNARAYGGGLNLGYAYQAITKTESRDFRWKVTPSTGLFYRDSSDLNQGAWVYNLGLSSSLAWQFSPGWVVNMGNSVSVSWNSGIKNYPDPIRDSQQMVSNGIQLYRMRDRWTIYGYILDTEAMRDVLVDSYQTYAVGAGYKLTKSRSVRFTLVYENGNAGYDSVRGTVGTSWQF